MTQNTSTAHAAAATGAHTTDGVPHGYTALTPFLAIPNAKGAIAFYQEVFGATPVSVTQMGAIVVHADLDFGTGRLQLGEPGPAYHLVPMPDGDDDCYSIAYYCDDVDSVVARAERAGARVREPVADFVSGDRFASIATRSACAGR